MQTTASPASRSPRERDCASLNGRVLRSVGMAFQGLHHQVPRTCAVLCPSKAEVESVLYLLESGRGYWQLSVKEEKGIRHKSNSLSSVISEDVYL